MIQLRLKEVIIKNFRGYREETRIQIHSDLTAFIGRNDVGKSSIFDALAIFFDSPLVKIEQTDLCVYSQSEENEIRIGCVFDELPNTITLDVTSTTNLQDEYLVNASGCLEIYKIFDCSLKTLKAKIVANAQHPTANGYADLLELKNSDLKNRLRQMNIEDADQRNNPLMRKALWKNCSDLQLSLTEVELNKEDAKKIWEQIQSYLPVFALFRSDRPSTDEDKEIQNPMQLAIQQVISELTNDLRQIEDKVRNAATDVAERTLQKLKELDPNLAKELNPSFRSDPKWESLFKLTLATDDQIPVNKRGSGVRRLILLAFFRAEAERCFLENSKSNIIYAIEEPETSQHPSNQRAIIQALKTLSSTDGYQVLISTHVPGLAEMIPTDALRYNKD